MKLVLPYAPTINHYYRPGARPGTHYLTAEARAYRIQVSTIVGAQRLRAGLTGRLRMTVVVNPPDRRERDLDNLQKALFDALQHAGVYERDSQIDELHMVRGPVVKGGRITVTIGELDADAWESWRTAMGDL